MSDDGVTRLREMRCKMAVRWEPEVRRCEVIGDPMGRTGSDTELITAVELASFAYCPEQWRQEYGLGLAPANQTARQAGRRHHRRKAGKTQQMYINRHSLCRAPPERRERAQSSWLFHKPALG
jgi:hypothetical protein